jgi:hypothetical protein
MGALPANPVARDAVVCLGVWVAFRLLNAPFSLREVVVAAALVGALHLGTSGVLREGAARPYVAQFVDLCASYANRERCRCAEAELRHRMSVPDFEEFAFRFYVDRMPPPALREALSGCS